MSTSIATRAQALGWPDEAVTAFRLGLTSIVAIYLCMLLQFDKPEWAGWTVLSVTLSTRASSLQKCLWRVLGSIVGAETAILLAASFAQDTLAFDIALAAWLCIVTTLSSIERRQQSYGFALMGFTVPIITLGEVQTPTHVFHVAVDRCSTILVGIGCAHVSSVLVAGGVRTVSRALADALDATARAVSAWEDRIRGGSPGAKPPVDAVLKLDDAVSDAFTEQPSLQTGGLGLTNAANRSLRVLAVGLLERRIETPAGENGLAHAAALLGIAPYDPDELLREMHATSERLRTRSRAGHGRRAPARPLARDWDGRQAVRNGIRAALAVGLASAFWYWSEWPTGSAAVTWAALLSVIMGARPDAPAASRNFLIGAALAGVVGVAVRYTALTVSGVFPLLAAVALPVIMLAAMGRLDTRAVTGQGYAMVVLDYVDPTNVMQYDLAGALNNVVASLIGMGVAVAAFAQLLPPASAGTRRRRAARRMARSLDAVIGRLSPFRPRRYHFLSRMFDRLSQLAPEGETVIEAGETLTLIGLLLLAIRAEDERFGRRIGLLLRAAGAEGGMRLREAAAGPGLAPLARMRIEAIAVLFENADFGDWPGMNWARAS